MYKESVSGACIRCLNGKTVFHSSDILSSAHQIFVEEARMGAEQDDPGHRLQQAGNGERHRPLFMYMCRVHIVTVVCVVSSLKSDYHNSFLLDSHNI